MHKVPEWVLLSHSLTHIIYCWIKLGLSSRGCLFYTYEQIKHFSFVSLSSTHVQTSQHAYSVKHTWQVRPSTACRSSVNSFPILKSMLKFLKVVTVRIFMAPVAISWVMSLVGFSRHTIFLRAKFISERKFNNFNVTQLKGGLSHTQCR